MFHHNHNSNCQQPRMDVMKTNIFGKTGFLCNLSYDVSDLKTQLPNQCNLTLLTTHIKLTGYNTKKGHKECVTKSSNSVRMASISFPKREKTKGTTLSSPPPSQDQSTNDHLFTRSRCSLLKTSQKHTPDKLVIISKVKLLIREQTSFAPLVTSSLSSHSKEVLI